MRLLKYLLPVLALFCTPADARVRGTAPITGPGRANLGISSDDLSAQTLTNALLASGLSYSSGATPAAVDADGYPVRNFTGFININISTGGNPGQGLPTAGPWTFAWDAGRSCFKLFTLFSATASNATNVTVTNGAGSGNIGFTGVCGQAGSVTLNFNAPSAGLIWAYDGSYTQYASNTTGRMWLSRSTNVGWNGQSDEVSYRTNGIYWTTEFVDEVKALRPESIRPMGWQMLILRGLTGTNVVNWGYRRPLSFTSYSAGPDYPPGTRCGGATSFCTFSVSNGAVTSAAAADTSLAGWVDGEQLTGDMGASTLTAMVGSAVGNNGGKCQFTVPSTTGLSPGGPLNVFGIGAGQGDDCNSQQTTVLTVDSATQFTTNTNKVNGNTCAGTCGIIGYQTLTITGKSGGSKLILSINGAPFSGTFPVSGDGSFTTFTYNSVLNAVIATSAGISNSPPIEAQVQLANLINTNFWYNIPTWANDGFVTGAANVIYSGLNSNLRPIFELSNEFFNFGQQAAQYSLQMGIALGITTGSSWIWQGLRTRQIHGNLLPASNWSAALARLDRVFCTQSGGDFTPISQAMSGTSLVSPGTAAYQAYVGGSAVNYNTSPNRPIDFTQSICHAPYTGGGTGLSDGAPDSNYTPTTYDAANLNAIGAAVDALNFATSNSIIDQYIRGDNPNRLQTVTASGTTFTTPLAHNFAVNDVVRFQVSGGTSYSGLTLTSTYKILSTPTSTTFTAGRCVAQVPGSAVNAGSAGSGTTTVGYVGVAGSSANQCYVSLSIFTQLSGPFTKFELIATTGFSPAPAGGTPKVRQYEASLEPVPPTVAHCTSIGVTTSYCGPSGSIATGITAWKNSTFAANTIKYFFDNQIGAASGTITDGVMPNSIAPSWLILNCGGIYALNSNCSPVSPAYWQLYYGFQTFSAN